MKMSLNFIYLSNKLLKNDNLMSFQTLFLYTAEVSHHQNSLVTNSSSALCVPQKKQS